MEYPTIIGALKAAAARYETDGTDTTLYLVSRAPAHTRGFRDAVHYIEDARPTDSDVVACTTLYWPLADWTEAACIVEGHVIDILSVLHKRLFQPA
jgi:hypothetical protein